MEDGFQSPAAMLATPFDSAMDLDFMDEVFLDGCWLEATDGFEILNQTPTTSNAPIDPLFIWPSSETNGDSSNRPSQKTNEEERQRLFYDESQERISNGTQFPPQATMDVAICSGGSVDHLIESSELHRRVWIGPKANPSPGSSVLDRLGRALLYIKDVMRDKDVLVQIWVPINRGGRQVLTTNDLPFALDHFNSPRLAIYRDISVSYQFSAEEDSEGFVRGLPGRVFSSKVPEWTPDVRFFRNDEYPRVTHAQEHGVRGSLALPVFEQGSKACLGVIEIVLTSPKIKYLPELESVCKALEAVDLRSSEVSSTLKASDKYCHAALPEIKEVLRSACETHRLPLAQTWVPCVQQGKEGCRHSDENYIQCVSTVDHACYVADSRVQPFHEACSEHHLLRGQGLVGKAFMTNEPCFLDDITSYCKTEYPLSHHAMMFELHASVAIRFRSIHGGADDFVLEFFLPVDCTDPEDQKKMLTSLSSIIQANCLSLRVVTDEELEGKNYFSINERKRPSDGIPNRDSCLTEGQHSSADVSLFPKENPSKALDKKLLHSRQNRKHLNLKQVADCDGQQSSLGEGSFSSVVVGKTGERRRSKAEKIITLQVLQQYFAGSLKDAAKSIGVCSTTLKRICRHHGIKRWPSRKIKKVGHSLQKLQHVIDSVQGASGTFEIDSFYSNFPDLASRNLSMNSPLLTSKSSDHLKPSNMQPEAAASKSSSSCSQTSCSSQCCSSKTQSHPSMWNGTSSEDLMVGENSGDSLLKRVRSEAELNAPTQNDMKLLPRSKSHRSLVEQHNTKNSPLLKNNDQTSKEKFRRVKVTYRDDKTRFRIQSNWGFKDLLQEIARRFDIEDMDQFDVKYLDDDSEWVLLTCDTDMEECIEVYQSTERKTIKLSVQPSRRHLRGCLGGKGRS